LLNSHVTATRANFARAIADIAQTIVTARAGSTLIKLSAFFSRGHAQQFAGEKLRLGELGNDVVVRVVGYRASGATSLYAGDFARARLCLEQGNEAYTLV
jgi:hypothetical protein